MSASQASLRAAADERKTRLAKLKSLKRKQPDDEAVSSEPNHPSPPESPDVARLHLSGRNYDPETKGPKLGFEAPPTLFLAKPTLEQQAAEVEAEIRRKAEDVEKDDQGVDLFKLQPKKPNWDLKRDLEKKLELLNVRTENAIANLVRERIENAQKLARSKGIATAISATKENGDELGMEGIALVEGLRIREREGKMEEQREKEDEEIV